MGIQRQLDTDLGLLNGDSAGQFGYRLVDHLAVEVVAHRCYVSTLAGPQEVAGPPDLQVSHGDAEARTQFSGLSDGAKTLVSLLA